MKGSRALLHTATDKREYMRWNTCICCTFKSLPLAGLRTSLCLCSKQVRVRRVGRTD